MCLEILSRVIPRAAFDGRKHLRTTSFTYDFSRNVIGTIEDLRKMNDKMQ
jgi:hypothetical protein